MLRTFVGGVPDDGVLVETLRLEEVVDESDIVVVLQHPGAVKVRLGGVLLRCVAPFIVQTRV